MEVYSIAGRYIWALIIIYSYFNISAPKPLLETWENDEKIIDEYKSLRKNILLTINIPWIIMGLGILSGDVPSVWRFFGPSNGDPFILLFFISAALVWIGALYWTFMSNGAEKVAKYQLFSLIFIGKRKEITASGFKLYLVLMVIVSIITTLMMFTQNVSEHLYR